MRVLFLLLCMFDLVQAFVPSSSAAFLSGSITPKLLALSPLHSTTTVTTTTGRRKSMLSWHLLAMVSTDDSNDTSNNNNVENGTPETKAAQQQQQQQQHCLSIEYCTGCRWMMRAAWMANELLTTFQDDISSITLIPSRSQTGGVFTVRYHEASSTHSTTDTTTTTTTTSSRTQQQVWDRKIDGGFPESKQLKQRVRNIIAPEKDLGHSDTSDDDKLSSVVAVVEDCEDCPPPPAATPDSSSSLTNTDSMKASFVPQPNLLITYCIGCQWLLRASWMAQEMLTTFQEELGSVTLIPSRPNDDLGIPGGTFRVELKNMGQELLLWDRKTRGRFPEPKEIKQVIRDQIAPDRNLGHADRSVDDSNSDIGTTIELVDELDDDAAADMRQFFGVQ